MQNVFRGLVKDADIDRRRRNLPHWQQPGCTYFITFRTADSLPQSKLRQINEQKAIWQNCHTDPWTEEVWNEYHARFTDKIQSWLDNGYGKCLLRHPRQQEIVATAFHHFDSDRYILDEYVVMPNHVHVIVMPADTEELKDILHSWKSFTANRLNEAHGGVGAFWMDENFDHVVRSWNQLEHFRTYIRENPSKAGLKEGESLLGKGKVGIVQS